MATTAPRSPTGPGAPGTRFAAVEGLRGLAAASVVLSHVYLYASPGPAYDLGRLDVVPRSSGDAGVVLFFTLSGFLLYRPFASALLTSARGPSLRSYFRNRLLRILPGYWFALLAAGVVLRATYLPPLQADGRSLADEPEVLAVNLLLLQGYHPSTLLTGIGPAWSLAVEVLFYLVLPLLAATAAVLATRTQAGTRRPWLAALVPAAALLGVGTAGQLLAAALPATGDGPWAGSWHAVVARSFLAQAGLFAAGVSLAVLQVQVARGSLRLPRRWPLWTGAAAGALGGASLLALASDRVPEHPATMTLSIGCALLLALVVLPDARTSVLTALLSSRPLQWAGLVSYGTFLWNEPLVWLLRRLGLTAAGTGGFLLALVSTLTLALGAGLLSWYAVERPALSWRRRGDADQATGGFGTTTATLDRSAPGPFPVETAVSRPSSSGAVP